MQIASCCFQISSVPAVIMAAAMIKDGQTVLGLVISVSPGRAGTEVVHWLNDTHAHAHTHERDCFLDFPKQVLSNYDHPPFPNRQAQSFIWRLRY